MEYAIDLGNLDALEAAFRAAPRVAAEELAAAAEESGALLAREAQERMQVGATGLLRSSTFHEVRALPAGVEAIVGTPMGYAAPVELGTRPHMPPVEPLVDWVKAKLAISNEKAARGVAFAIARKIAVRGTKPQAPFKRTFDAQEAAARAIFARAMERIAARMAGGAA